MTNKAGTMNLQWGETGAEVLERRLAVSTARARRQQETLQRQRREGQGVTRPLEAVPEMDRYMYDLQGVSAAPVQTPFAHASETPHARTRYWFVMVASMFWLLQYLIIKGAVGAPELAAMNAAVDRQEGLKLTESQGLTAQQAQQMMADPDSYEWQDLAAKTLHGVAFANGAEGVGGDPAFDNLIAHPSWITHIKDFVAQERTVFTNGGGVVLRWPGQASGAHGGGEERHVGHKSGNRTWDDPLEYDDSGHYVSGYEDGGAGQFDGQLVSVLLALNDSPIGGGNTAVVPGSKFFSDCMR